MRVAIFGPTGKVGSEVLRDLMLQNTARDLELVLLARNTDRVNGVVSDIENAAALLDLGQSQRIAPHVTVTRDPRDLKGASLAVIAAAAWPTAEERKTFAGIDPSGRLVQSHVNFDMVQDISRDISKHAPEALTLVVTNQSDMMAEAARDILPPEQVLGFGGLLDAARLRTAGEQVIRTEGITGSMRGGANYMVGYHNADMIPLTASLAVDFTPEQLAAITQQARDAGKIISKLKKDFNAPQLDTGAAIGPGYAVYSTVAGLTGQRNLTGAFNARLDADTAKLYGTRAGGALSVPVRLKKGGFEFINTYNASTEEQVHLRAAQRRMETSMDELRAQHDALRVKNKQRVLTR